MGTMSSRTLRTKTGQAEITVGDLIAALYDEARRVTKNGAEADRLAKASVQDVLRRGHVRSRRHG